MIEYPKPSEVAAIGCIVCRRQGVYSPATIHHVRKLATSKKRKLAPIIPLCPAHHQTGGYGVALHDGEESFETNYGPVLGMVEEVKLILGK